jgi:hypothetical protein
MEENHLHKIRVRRGTNSQRKQVLFEDGELVYINDIKRLYVGDLKTNGGIKTSNNNQIIPKKEKPVESDIGDILFNKLNKSVFIVDRDENLLEIMGSLDDYNKFKERLDALEDLLNRLETDCCNLDFALDTDDSENILTDYGDWIRVKYGEIVKISCSQPIISSKYLNLKTGKTYILDISNTTSDPDIIFENNLIDRDINTPPQNIKIIKESVLTSSNIKILEITDTTIKFFVDPLSIEKYIGAGVYIYYDIQNDCEYTQEKNIFVGGIAINFSSSIKVEKLYLNEYKQLNSDINIIENTRQNNNLYQIFDRNTNLYPFNTECWFLFYFKTNNIGSEFHITMVDKYPSLINENNLNQIYHSFLNNKTNSIMYGGMYLFWHPKNMDLNIWSKTSTDILLFPVYDTQEHVNSPNRFFNKINIKPNLKQIKSVLVEKNILSQFSPMPVDYTGIFYDKNPNFIQIF